MSILSDTIESFIKEMMNEYEDKIDLQRNELAQHFNCGAFSDKLCSLQQGLRRIEAILLKAGVEGEATYV